MNVYSTTKQYYKVFIVSTNKLTLIFFSYFHLCLFPRPTVVETGASETFKQKKKEATI